MSKILIKIITVLLFCVIVLSCVMIVRENLREQREIEEFDQLASLVTGQNTDSDKSESTVDTESSDIFIETEPAPVFKRNLQPVFDQNPDCIGWICIENTRVDYPVMFTPEEPQKYLRKSFGCSYSISGTPFLNDNGGPDFDHLIIYGHNMKNGTMFSDLEGYLSADYCRANSVIEFETAEGLKCFEVFAVVQLKNTDEWYSFTNADSAETYDTLIEDIKSRAIYETGVDAEWGQQILTLSTCYGPKDDDRLIVVATEIKP